MQQLIDALERLPVATLTHLIVAVVLGVDLIIDGNLSHDALTYAGIVEGGNGLVGLGRAHLAGQKARADAVVSAAAASLDGGAVTGLTQGVKATGTVVDETGLLDG